MWTVANIADIRVGDRLRPIDESAVAGLAESIQARGLLQPIVVTPLTGYRNGRPEQVPLLVAGLHRLRAAERLGQKTIRCVTVEADEAERLLIEIDENLARKELGDAMRAKFLARRKELYLIKHPETAPVSERGGPGRGKTTDNLSGVSFAADTAAKSGLDERTVRREVRRGEKIADKVLDAVAGTEMDKGVELDALAALNGKQQIKAVEMVKTGKVESIREAKERLKPKPVNLAPDPLNDLEVDEKQVAALMSAWNKASRVSREEFLCRIDRPIMDRIA